MPSIMLLLTTVGIFNTIFIIAFFVYTATILRKRGINLRAR